MSQLQAARVPDIQRCFEWRTVEQAIQYTTDRPGHRRLRHAVGASKLFEPPLVETEGVDQILSMTTDLHENSTNLAVAKLVRFPELRSNKLGMDLSLLVPKIGAQGARARRRELLQHRHHRRDRRATSA